MEEVEAQAVAAGAEAPAGAASVSGLTQEAWQAISVIPSAPAAMPTEATAAATGSTTAAAVPARKRPAEVIADDTERASRDAEVAVEPGGTKRRDDVGDDSARSESRGDDMSSIEAVESEGKHEFELVLQALPGAHTRAAICQSLRS